MDLAKKSSDKLPWHLIHKNWPGLFFILDTDLKILSASKDVLQTLRLSETDIYHKSISYLYTLFDENEEIDDLKWRLSFEYISCTGDSHRMNIRKMMLRDGWGKKSAHYWRPINVPVYDEDRELCYVIHQVEEVAPGDKPEAAIEGFDIISIINDGIYEINFKTEKVRWNDQLFKILGYSIGEIELNLATMLRTIHQEDRRRVRDLIRIKKHYAPDFEIEFRLKKKSGDFIDVLSKGIISRNKIGEALKLTATIHDVSSYKEQERLKAHLELITDSVPAIIFYIDSDLKYQFANSACLDLLCTAHDDVVGSYVRDVVDDRIFQLFLPNALKVLEGQKMEIEGSTEVNGQIRSFKTWYLPDIVKEHVRGFVGLTMDVTEEKSREEALKKATEEKQSLLNQLRQAHRKISRDKDVLKNFFMEAPAIIAIHEGPDYIIKYLNKNAAHVYGDWIGEPFYKITSKEVYQRIVKIFDKACREQKEYSLKAYKIIASRIQGKEVENQRREFFFDMVVQPTLDANGESTGVILYANDVTDVYSAKRAMEESAKKNRLLLESMPTIACTYDVKGNVDYLNAAWYDYTGQRRTGALENTIKSALHPEDVTKNEKLWARCLVQSCNYDEYLRIKDRDGKYKWHHHRVVPMKDENDKVIRWVGSATYVDEEIKANEKKDEFIGIASHELKTPLTSVKAYIQLIQLEFAEASNEPVKAYLQKAYRNAEKLNDLISELLDVSRIQSGKMELNIKPFNFDDMVKEVVESNQHLTITHQIKLRGKTGVIIHGDRERLEQILNNLLSNAIKYSPGKDEVVVNIFKTDNHVIVDVTDFGAGISKHEQRKLFEQFYRAKNVSKGASGLGMGLYISLAIAKEHRGHIAIQSEKGIGSTFTLILPRQ